MVTRKCVCACVCTCVCACVCACVCSCVDAVGTWVTYSIDGLSTVTSAVHAMHVHTWGNIAVPTGSGVSSHYVGGCNVTMCRPGASLQEVGYLFDGVGVTAAEYKTSFAQRFDGVVSLQGPLSIVGRSVIVHGNSASTTPFVAQVRH